MGAHSRTEMLRLRGVLLTILRLLGLRARLLSILAVEKKVHALCETQDAVKEAAWRPRAVSASAGVALPYASALEAV